MKLKVIKTDCRNPYMNLAAEEHLTFNAEEGEVILYLWQNAHTVVIGRNQNPWRECNVERIKQDGVYLARRMSGGGAVYHDLGNLNFTFIARDGLYDIGRQTDVILLACRLMGVNAVKTGRNDLTVDGKKFSGHAYYSSNGYNYHHGTVMMCVASEDLPKYLRVSEAKLKSKGVASVRSRVANLVDYIPEEYITSVFGSDRLQGSAYVRDCGQEGGQLICPGSSKMEDLIFSMQDAMVRAAEREYRCRAEFIPLPEIPEELVEKYSSEEWRLGTKIPFEKDIERRFEWGGVEIQLCMRGEYIEQCRIYSDSLETEIFGILEDLITGCRYDASELLGVRLPNGVSSRGYEVLELIASSIDR